MAEPTTAIRIADTPIPPPSAARLHPVRPPLYRRQSRFTEEMAEDHTPVPSLYEHDDETSRSRIHQPRESPMPSPTTATPTLLAHSSSSSSLSNILRGMNGCAHGAACVILIAIMVEFLTQSRGHWYGKIRYAPFPPFPSPVANPPPPPPEAHKPSPSSPSSPSTPPSTSSPSSACTPPGRRGRCSSACSAGCRTLRCSSRTSRATTCFCRGLRSGRCRREWRGRWFMGFFGCLGRLPPWWDVCCVVGWCG